MTQKEIKNMDTDEFYNWMAYDMLKDEKFKERVQGQMSAEASDEERAHALKAFFGSM